MINNHSSVCCRSLCVIFWLKNGMYQSQTEKKSLMIDGLQLVSMIKGTVSLSAGQSCTCLPPESVAYIWSYLTLKDLVKFGHTSHQNYHLVRSALKNTIY